MANVLLVGGPVDLDGTTRAIEPWPQATVQVTAADGSDHQYVVDEFDLTEPYTANHFAADDYDPTEPPEPDRKGAAGERGLSGGQGAAGAAGTNALARGVLFLGGSGALGTWKGDGWQGAGQKGRSLRAYTYQDLVAGVASGPTRVILGGAALYTPHTRVDEGLVCAYTPDRMQAAGTLMSTGLPAPSSPTYLRCIARFVYCFATVEQYELAWVAINTSGEMHFRHRTDDPGMIPNDAQGKQWTGVFAYGLDGRGYSTA